MDMDRTQVEKDTKTTSQEKLSSETLKDKGIEADQRTPGEEELSKR